MFKQCIIYWNKTQQNRWNSRGLHASVTNLCYVPVGKPSSRQEILRNAKSRPYYIRSHKYGSVWYSTSWSNVSSSANGPFIATRCDPIISRISSCRNKLFSGPIGDCLSQSGNFSLVGLCSCIHRLMYSSYRVVGISIDGREVCMRLHPMHIVHECTGNQLTINCAVIGPSMLLRLACTPAENETCLDHEALAEAFLKAYTSASAWIWTAPQ